MLSVSVVAADCALARKRRVCMKGRGGTDREIIVHRRNGTARKMLVFFQGSLPWLLSKHLLGYAAWVGKSLWLWRAFGKQRLWIWLRAEDWRRFDRGMVDVRKWKWTIALFE